MLIFLHIVYRPIYNDSNFVVPFRGFRLKISDIKMSEKTASRAQISDVECIGMGCIGMYRDIYRLIVIYNVFWCI